MGSAALQADGRVLRGERTRTAIVDALIELLEEGEERPRAKAIAERAEVSVRSLFQHFEDREALDAAVAQRQGERLAHLIAAPSDQGPLVQRIDALVTHRDRLFERIAPVRRATLRSGAAASPVVARRRDHLDRTLRAQVVRQFAPELHSLDRRARDEAVAAVDAVTSFAHWEHLRAAGLTASATRRVTAATVQAVLLSLHSPMHHTTREDLR